MLCIYEPAKRVDWTPCVQSEQVRKKVLQLKRSWGHPGSGSDACPAVKVLAKACLHRPPLKKKKKKGKKSGGGGNKRAKQRGDIFYVARINISALL